MSRCTRPVVVLMGLMGILVPVITPAAEEQAAVAQVKFYNGAPTLFINGEPHFTMMMMTPWWKHEATEQGKVKLLAEVQAGIDLHSTCDNLDLRYFNQFWYGPGKYNYELFDAKLKSVAENNPAAYVFIKLYVQAPEWWVLSHPNDVVGYATGYEPDRRRGAGPTEGVNLCNGSKGGVFVSYASRQWRNDVKDMLTAFVRHLDEVPWGRRVIGINLLNGHCQEWHYWGSIFGLHPDTSKPMTGYFRRWLRDTYPAGVEHLKKAWKDPKVDFDTAVVPGVAVRLNNRHFYFRDPTTERPVIDYYRAQHQLAAEVLIDFCRTVKQVSGNRLLAGAYYGYLFHTPWYPDGLSLGLNRVLNSRYVDFLAAPANYNDWLSRGLGGDALARGLTEACKTHGKLYITESDEGTYKADRVHRPCEAMHNWEQSVANMRKQFGQIIVRSIGNWWWDWEPEHGLYIYPRHIEALKQFKRIGDLSLQLDRSANSQVALVYNLETFYYTAYANFTNTDANLTATWDFVDVMPHVLSRCGFPFDIITVDDLGRANLPEYKLYIFPQCFYASRQTRRRVRRLLAGTSATALWVYAPGYVDDTGLSTHSMFELTGIHFKEIPVTAAMKVELTNQSHPITKAFNSVGTIMQVEIGRGDDNQTVLCRSQKEFCFGGRRGGAVGPVLYVDDDSATVLGRIAGVGKPGFAVKQVEGWTSIYSAAIPSSTELIRRIARSAGVHIYCEKDAVLMISRHFLCLASKQAGEPLKIHLPYRTDVYDVYRNQWIAEESESFMLEVPADSTRLLYYGRRGKLGI